MNETEMSPKQLDTLITYSVAQPDYDWHSRLRVFCTLKCEHKVGQIVNFKASNDTDLRPHKQIWHYPVFHSTNLWWFWFFEMCHFLQIDLHRTVFALPSQVANDFASFILQMPDWLWCIVLLHVLLDFICKHFKQWVHQWSVWGVPRPQIMRFCRHILEHMWVQKGCSLMCITMLYG